MKNVYKIRPYFAEYLWGGDKLIKEFNKQTTIEKCGESWELSTNRDGESTVEAENGLIRLSDFLTDAIIGENSKGFEFFPLLVKLIDAKDDLSIQVHPSDEYALKNENSFGKTEMWYILSAKKGAYIYYGLKKDLDKSTFEKSVHDGSILEHLNKVYVHAGENYFVPSGTIHAICGGITIYEIQQNSNITYRLFDFARKDKNGQVRELHFKQSAEVSHLTKIENKDYSIQTNNISTDKYSATEEILATCKYFSSIKYTFDGEFQIKGSRRTFKAVTFVCGEGEIQNEKYVKGDTFFIKATDDIITINGKGELLMACVNKYYLAIDLGGTMIKGGIIDDEGRLIVKDLIDTESGKGFECVEENIVKLSEILLKKSGMKLSDITAMGMGIPGMINSKKGIVTYSNNLSWENVHIVEDLQKVIDIPIYISNDANVAALGEIVYGTGGAVSDAVVVTLGTGVGSGIVANGELIEGNESAGAEFGHTTLIMGGEPCTCGRCGCVEAYVSATALIRDTKRALAKNPQSKMWSAINVIEDVNAKLPFDFSEIDDTARILIDNYVAYLGESLANLGNIFRPYKIILGGGISYQGDRLVKRVQTYVDKIIYGFGRGADVEIVTAKLKNDAGIFGACALCEQKLGFKTYD